MYRSGSLENTEARNADRLIVAHDDTPLLGVSGHRIATLNSGDEVTKVGEYGSYAIVHCLNHHGYVESRLLAKPSDLARLDKTPSERADRPANASETGRRRSILPWLRGRARTAAVFA